MTGVSFDYRMTCFLAPWEMVTALTTGDEEGSEGAVVWWDEVTCTEVLGPGTYQRGTPDDNDEEEQEATIISLQVWPRLRPMMPRRLVDCIYMVHHACSHVLPYCNWVLHWAMGIHPVRHKIPSLPTVLASMYLTDLPSGKERSGMEGR